MISHEDACALIDTPAAGLPELLARAGELRDRGRGRTVTFSAKVFVPLTTLCRDYCGYCTFRRDPGEPGAHTMAPEEVVALAQAGGRLGAKEALFSLGDKPEAAFASHREFLRRHGHRTTLSYLRAVCAAVLANMDRFANDVRPKVLRAAGRRGAGVPVRGERTNKALRARRRT